jgi:hypothetical protein
VRIPNCGGARWLRLTPDDLRFCSAGSKAAVLAMGVLSHGLILGLIVVFGVVSVASLPRSSIRTVGKYIAERRARVGLRP